MLCFEVYLAVMANIDILNGVVWMGKSQISVGKHLSRLSLLFRRSLQTLPAAET